MNVTNWDFRHLLQMYDIKNVAIALPPVKTDTTCKEFSSAIVTPGTTLE